MHTEPVELKVVLKNLIANAVKFTRQGRVTVRTYGGGGGVKFEVADTGVGIPPETVPIIFEPFRQGDPSLARPVGSIGLGLHVARRLLDALGGAITVDRNVGHGLTFRVWVPSKR